MKRLALSALLFAGCTIEPLFTGVPGSFEELVLIKDGPISGGAMVVNLAITPRDVIEFPVEDENPLPGGNENPNREADIHLELDVRYAAAGVQGGRNIGDFVPYLIVEAEIENLDTSETLSTVLTPHVSLNKGYRYGRNIPLVDTLGLSEAGYRIRVEIHPPALVTDPDFTENPHGRSALSPGLSIGPDLLPFLAGTVFSIRPLVSRELDVIELFGAFTLADFLGEAGGGGGGGGGTGYSY